jgi:hypothetical protein
MRTGQLDWRYCVFIYIHISVEKKAKSPHAFKSLECLFSSICLTRSVYDNSGHRREEKIDFRPVWISYANTITHSQPAARLSTHRSFGYTNWCYSKISVFLHGHFYRKCPKREYMFAIGHALVHYTDAPRFGSKTRVRSRKASNFPPIRAIEDKSQHSRSRYIYRWHWCVWYKLNDTPARVYFRMFGAICILWEYHSMQQ